MIQDSYTTSYEAAKKSIYTYLAEVPLHLQVFDQDGLLHLVAESKRRGREQGFYTIEQACVNYLRHSASAYDQILQQLHRPDELWATKMERHVLHVERRRCVAGLKKRILDEIAAEYPWLGTECARQKGRDGVEDEPSEYALPFNPFKGCRLREIDTDYLMRLLGMTFVRRGMRTRIERHLAERQAEEARARLKEVAS